MCPFLLIKSLEPRKAKKITAVKIPYKRWPEACHQTPVRSIRGVIGCLVHSPARLGGCKLWLIGCLHQLGVPMGIY